MSGSIDTPRLRLGTGSLPTTLEPVLSAAASLGIPVTRDGDWTLWWGWTKPWSDPNFKSKASRMRSASRSAPPQFAVNHVAGLQNLISKPELSKFAASLTAANPRLFAAVTPEAYVLPRQLGQLRKRIAERGVADSAGWPYWLVKKVSHRGIRTLTNGSAASLRSLGTAMVQARVQPLLLNAAPRVFDIGLYVMVSSVQPLRVFLFGEQLVRFGKESYPRSPAGFSNTGSFVINDYSPVWQLPGLSSSLASCDGSPSCTLRQQLKAEGHDADRLTRQMHSTVASLLAAARPTMQAGFYKVPVPSPATFELLRFDFLVNASGMPLLTEVNMSPNLVSKTVEDGAVKQNLLRAVLSVAAVRLKHGQKTIGKPAACRRLATGKQCCSLSQGCPGAGVGPGECLTVADVRMLARAAAEEREAVHRGMQRIFPPPAAAATAEMMALWPQIPREDALGACWAAAQAVST
jgi:hypothetical protein